MPFTFRQIAKYLLAAIPMAIMVNSCTDNTFKLKGEIEGGAGQILILEKSDFQGQWNPVDSTRINKNGGFSLKFPAPSSPEIFRLSLNDQYVYFPIDSTETITLNSSINNFGGDFSLEGSANAEKLESFEKRLHRLPSENIDSMIAFKREVYSTYMKDFPGSILSFYILTKVMDDKPLYSPTEPTDRKYFAAVANGFKTMRPDDPHTTLLEEVAIEALKQKNNENGNFRTLEANEISLIEIDLPDETGKNIKLSDIAGKGKPVVVIFSLLNMPESPELNIRLAEIYRKHSGNIEFYNVSLDADQYEWREAAKNLPWITVYSPGQNSSEDAIRYNVYQVPSFYIYDTSGELKSRPMTLEELNKSL